MSVTTSLLASGCAPLPTYEARADKSSLACIESAIAGRNLEALPDDAEAHCIAAGLIALRCSVTEAWIAGVGKELRDLLGPGDAEIKDLRNDARGVECARATGKDGLDACCRQSP
jgi:hypothetical protein